MRLLFDMFELSLHAGKSIGIYNYALGLLRGLAQRPGRDWEIVVACHGDNAEAVRAAAGSGAQVRVLHAQRPGALRRQWWLRVGCRRAARALGCTVYLSPKGFLPGWRGRPRGLRSCVVVHDLISLWYAEQLPGHVGRLEAWLVDGGLLRACREADRVIAISQATADDIVRRTGRRDGLHVVPNGLEPAPAPAPATPSPPGPYILAMASTLPHKNLATVLAAYRRYRELVPAPLPLLVCGSDGAEELGVGYRRGLSREALFAHYRGASLFVFLPRIEGFGYPPLEAMQAGVPVLCSDIAALRESTAGAACLTDAMDAEAAAQRMAWLLSDAGAAERERQRAAAPAVLARHGWPEAAAAIARVVETLA